MTRSPGPDDTSSGPGPRRGSPSKSVLHPRRAVPVSAVDGFITGAPPRCEERRIPKNSTTVLDLFLPPVARFRVIRVFVWIPVVLTPHQLPETGNCLGFSICVCMCLMAVGEKVPLQLSLTFRLDEDVDHELIGHSNMMTCLGIRIHQQGSLVHDCVRSNPIGSYVD